VGFRLWKLRFSSSWLLSSRTGGNNVNNLRNSWKSALQSNCWHMTSGTLGQLPAILVLVKDRDRLIAIDGLQKCCVTLVSWKWGRHYSAGPWEIFVVRCFNCLPEHWNLWWSWRTELSS
jgi:hypothetical protein